MTSNHSHSPNSSQPLRGFDVATTLWLRLIRSRRVGPRTFHRLRAEHGSAERALAALPQIAKAAGVKDYQVCPQDMIDRECAAAVQAQARPLFIDDPNYPAALRNLPDAPPFLWAQGNLQLLNKPALALVGARNASSLGMRMARAMATDLGAAEQIIASGLARGIDTAAHEASIKSGTIAVVAGGVDVVYPAENTQLAAKLRDAGLILSEQPMGTHPKARHFPARNRLISGLARAVVVIEAAAKSGSLITAQCALDQGRDVLAVPGHPFDGRAAGCNMLIRDGATLVRHGADVLEALTPPPAPEPEPETANDAPEVDLKPTDTKTARDMAKLHHQILQHLGPSPVAEDQLLRDLKLTAHQATPALVDLELTGKIARRAGGLLARNG